jgi:endonuclease I
MLSLPVGDVVTDRSTPSELGATLARAPPRPIHYSRPQTSDRIDVFDALRLLDASDASDASGASDASDAVRLLYSQYDVPAGPRDREYASGWTREHVFPQSHARMTVARPGAGTDLHNLFAADASVNSARNDKDFDDCRGPDSRAVIDKTPAAGRDGRLLCRTTTRAWEPPDCAKGTVARAILYTACAYADALGLRVTEEPSGPGSRAIGRLSTLLRWNREHPPDAREMRRNDAVERIQGNRNPFADDPGLADRVRW